ncbi:MAG TPA: HEAT repeat domain-containing protein [Pyrinomonadaceae bacterium]|nr:HEAT repeat domain-containing protein [Pyrinomonadaceae bacterium]
MKRLTPREPLLTRTAAAAALLMLAALLLAPARAHAEAYWVDGYELDIALEPGEESFVLGERPWVFIKVENRSRTGLEMLWSIEQGRGWPDDFDVRVVDPDGAVLPRPPADESAPGSTYASLRVRAPGDPERVSPVTRVTISLDPWAKILKPGRYTVVVRRGLRVGAWGGRYRLFPGTTKPAVEVSVKTEIEVVGGGAEHTGRMVEELGAKMLECEQPLTRAQAVESAMRLSEIDDERVVGHFARALARCGAGSIRSAALKVFGKFETEAAFEGLRRAAGDADEDFRTLAALELSRSKHPKARELLLSLREDPFYGVRLMVLSALKDWDTERARRLIWEMTNDEHPMIKEEALRFLQERATHPPRR